ncbi:hypothetical protein PG996_003621 [Apiospora saccharicola]|uniref:Transmembrane protein n=1 Tax=Apiospora saccharicola TaxID=335842 RepID=A0ABR1W4F7_9PEZI
MSPHSPSAVSGQRSQASFLLHAKRDQGEPFAGEVLGLLVSLIALVGLTAFLSRHTQIPQQQSPVKVWKKIPFVIWTVFAVLADSWVFVLATIILSHGSGANWADWRNCSAAIIICLILYVATKIVRELLPDNKTLQLVANITPVHMPLLGRESGTYVVVLTLNFVHRISRLENGRCIIGARRSVLVPLIACDVLVNIYLTTLFLIPLRNLNSSTGMLRTSVNARLRSIALRTFIGACCTATSSIINLSFLMALNGEVTWLCFLCCNTDSNTSLPLLPLLLFVSFITSLHWTMYTNDTHTFQVLFSAMVIQWVTGRDGVNDMCSSCASCSDHYRPDALIGGCPISEACPYYATGRRSSVTTWCCRRPSDGTIRAASLMLRRDSVASVHTRKPSFSHNNSNSSDYHEAVASAGPIHWDNIFTLFGNDDGHGKQASSEVTPSTLEAATAAAVGSGDDSVVNTTTSATTTDYHPLQRPKPSRTLSSIHSIGSIVTGDPSQEEWAQRLEIGEEEKIAEKTDEIQ